MARWKFILARGPVAAMLLAAVISGTAAADAVLIDFSSPHCGPCVAMQPTIAQLERSGVPVRHVNVMSEQPLARRYGIRSTPTYVVLVDGKEVTRLTGMQSLTDLRDALSINPSGPLIPTGARWTPQRPDPQPAADNAPPQSRSAMLGAPTRPGNPRQLAGRSDRPGVEAMPSAMRADAVQRAEAATVRLRVHDGNGFGAGTGTIIDTHGDEALVLTCGHLFRENKGAGRIDVDLFVAGEVKTVAGQVVDYEAENRDIALVAIRPGFPVQPVPLIQMGSQVRTGQVAFSYGCDRGDPPTRRDTRITGVNKYNQHLGVSNLEISGAPIDGRSGGGLFDEEGRLIGVCNAADYKEDLGIYAGPGSVHWQLEKVNLAHLYNASSTPNVASQTAPTRPAALPATAGPASQEPFAQASSAAPGQSPKEVIVIIRDRNDPGGSAEVRTITQPTAEFISLIDRQTR